MAAQTIESSLCGLALPAPAEVGRDLTAALPTLVPGHLSVPALEHNSGKHFALPSILHQTQDHAVCCCNGWSCPVDGLNVSRVPPTVAEPHG